MHLIFVSRDYPFNSESGTEIFAGNLAIELAHQGNNITIICGQTTQAETSAVDLPRGLNVHSVCLRVPYVRWIDFSWKCWLVIQKIATASTVDAIVAFGARTFPYYAFRMIRRLKLRPSPLLCYYAIDSMLSEYERTKVQYVSKGVINFAHTWAWYRALVDSDKRASRQADIVLASCRDTAERIEADYCIDPSKVSIVYLGVPDDFASNSHSRRRDCVFLHVCTDTSAERKGTRYFLQALRLLQVEYGIHAKGMVVGPCNTYKRLAEV